MSDLRDLPDLAREMRERVVTPPYDAVSRRVRQRRLRGATGAVAAAVLVVGGVAVWQDAATTAGPPRPQPGQESPLPPTDDSLWRAVVDGTDSHPFQTAGTDDGSIAVVWRALEQPAPTFALVIRETDGTVHGRRLDEPVRLTPVPGGWVGVHSARAWFISSDGSWQDLGQRLDRRTARGGDVLVHGQGRDWLYSPADQTLSTGDPLPDGADGYVTPDGRMMTCQWDGRDEIFFGQSDIMRPGLPGKSCVIVGRGDALAIVALGDDPDGGIPMTGAMTYADLTWHYPRVTDLLDGVTSVVITPDESTVVTNADDGRWFLIRRDGEVTEPQRKVGEAFVAGDRLYVSTYGLMNGPLYYSEDDGQTWTETVLPGNESKQD
jgi:hypothetical protein